MATNDEKRPVTARRFVLQSMVTAALIVVAVAILGYRPAHYLSVAQALKLAGVNPYRLSPELADAPPAHSRSARVAGWLRAHRGDIDSASRRFGVDNWAVARVIAYEALENVHGTLAGLGHPERVRKDCCRSGASDALQPGPHGHVL